MTEVHDMVRSPHPAKPFHFGPFVSLQFLIFMIAPPDITPTSGPDLTAAPNSGEKKMDRTYKQGWQIGEAETEPEVSLHI